MNLHNFESCIDKKIVARGYDYYKNEIFYKQLIPEFKDEVYTLFLQHIEQTAARAGSRKDYQRVCAIIRNLKKAGGQKQVSEIKQKLFNKYANRPAFRDELSKV